MTTMQIGVASPCTSVCRMDDASGLCIGCARTLDEIASWSVLDDDARRAIVAALPSRKAHFAAFAGSRR
jgi:predicted Fe-S protein YdhL (DUF1289 family)